ncbi:MAG: hypothetical protein V1928_04290 [Parcubacteria group bacterium]
MQTKKFHRIMNVFIVSVVFFFAATLASNALTDFVFWQKLLIGAGAFMIVMIFGVVRIFSVKKPDKPDKRETNVEETKKPVEKKKFNWENFWIFVTGIVMISGFVLGVYFIGKPIVEFFIPDKPPKFNPSAIQTLGNDPLTPYVPPGMSNKGLLFYDNVLIDLQPGQEFTVATLINGQRYTWKLNNGFYLVIRDGKGGERLITQPPGSDIVQQATGDGDLVIKSNHYTKGMFRIFNDKEPVFQRLPLFKYIEKHGLP